MDAKLPLSLRRRFVSIVLLSLAFLAVAGVAQAEDRIYAGAQCSLTSVESTFEDRYFGKLMNTASTQELAVCPVSRLRGESNLEYIEIDLTGDPADHSCVLWRRRSNGTRSSHETADWISVNEGLSPGGLWRIRFFRGAAELGLGSLDALAIHCNLEPGTSILRYRVNTN